MAGIGRVSGLAVNPGTPHSLHLTALDLPEIARGDVEIRVLEAGICGTDREIIAAKFGSPPPSRTDLVIGHEVLGLVESVGSQVLDLRPGDLVTATVRRGCGCPQCAVGASDFCTAMRYRERGIIGLDGYLIDRFVESVEHVVKVPVSLRDTGVLIEPTSVAEKAWRVASSVQSRIAAWIPRTAIVFGAGPIGLLQTLLLRIRDIEVFTVARRPANQTMASAIVAGCGATYLSTAELHIAANNVELPNIDVIVEASGSGDAVDAAMSLLGIGGVLVLLSITGGSREVSMPLDRINFEFVTGNKAMVGSVNSTVADFQAAITDLLQFEQRWPGLTGRMITHRLGSLDEAVDLMTTTRGAIKAVVDLT